MTIKPIFRYDRIGDLYRLFRITWTTGAVGDGRGYSAKLSIGLWPRLWYRFRGHNDWALTVAGVRIHYHRSYGGVLV